MMGTMSENNQRDPHQQDAENTTDQNRQSEENQDNDQQPERKRPGKKPLIILAVVVVIMLIVGLWFWLSTRNIETTDDAFTEGDAVTIAHKASGYVVKLLVKDNQRVK